MRPGRLVYTALEATLKIYLDGPDAARERIPTLAQLTVAADELRSRADHLAEALGAPEGLKVEVAECRSQAGSGSLPLREIPSWGVRLTSSVLSPDELARRISLDWHTEVVAEQPTILRLTPSPR